MAPLSSVTLSDIGELRRATESNARATPSSRGRYERIRKELSSMLDLQIVALSLVTVRSTRLHGQRSTNSDLEKRIGALCSDQGKGRSDRVDGKLHSRRGCERGIR